MSAQLTQLVSPAQRIEELGRIILAYSEVTEKLQRSHDQLTQTVQKLSEELSEKNRQLERRSRLAALGEMAAGMAHEIRNPLGGIQLYASMLAGDVGDRPASLELVRKISGGVKHLDALVSQVLQFTREIAVNAVEMDLAAVVGQSVDLASERMRANRVTCAIEGPKAMPVVADPRLIGQAVLNLVLNAAEALAAGGAVMIRLSSPTRKSGARQFHLVVQDTGAGIEPALLERIFNPFFTTKETGTGLGLAIVHRIVEAHDGTITASNADGGGARFEIRI
jgi:signal transduction histidine kinase